MSSYFIRAREPVNSLTHLIGAVLSTLGTLFLLSAATSAVSVLSAAVFGLSLVALYSASALYHYVRCSPKALLRLRKLDHAMIYVLISGSYTPLLLRFSERGALMCGIIWGVALGGILLKLVWMQAPRWLSTLLYLALGWAIVFDPAAIVAIPVPGLWLLAGGGAFYSIGAVIYALKKPNLGGVFQFHELFHIFVLLGSLCHFLLVYLYAL